MKGGWHRSEHSSEAAGGGVGVGGEQAKRGSQAAKREGGERREEGRRRMGKGGRGVGTAIAPHNSEAAGRAEVTEVASVGVSDAREKEGGQRTAPMYI